MVAACGVGVDFDPPEPDAAARADGSGGLDAGGPRDAGAATDAGPATDAGNGLDAGPPPDDAGATDAGAPPPDAGVADGGAADAGTDASAWADAGSGCLGDGDCNDGDPCTTDSCAAGMCRYVAMSCDDGSLCTVDSCVSGVCVHPYVDCNDGNACTDDHCSPSLGCQHPDHVCTDMNACTADSCDTTTGCAFTVVDADGDGHSPARLGSCGDDCDDSDARALPGEMMYFTTPRMPVSAPDPLPYDFNCNGVQEKEFTTLYFACTFLAPGTPSCPDAGGCCIGSGWAGSGTAVPACGVTTGYVACVSMAAGSCLPTSMSLTQACR